MFLHTYSWSKKKKKKSKYALNNLQLLFLKAAQDSLLPAKTFFTQTITLHLAYQSCLSELI